jgi:D-xylose transport system substrate-binding protein
MATQAAKLAVDLASGENVAPTDIRESNGKILVPSILLNSILVTKDNLEQTVIASGYHTKDEIYH